MIDVIERLQKAETRPLDADGKTQLWETLQDARAEITRLREAIRRLAEQDATLSVVGGNVIVQMDATLTDAEREAVDTAEASLMRESTDLNTPLPVRQRLGAAAATLRGLLERLANEVGGRLVPLLATDFAAQAPDFASQPPDIAGSVTIRQPVTLTDEEREAVEWASDAYENCFCQRVGLDNNGPDDCGRVAATLRGLLERLGGGK